MMSLGSSPENHRGPNLLLNAEEAKPDAFLTEGPPSWACSDLDGLAVQGI